MNYKFKINSSFSMFISVGLSERGSSSAKICFCQNSNNQKFLNVSGYLPVVWGFETKSLKPTQFYGTVCFENEVFRDKFKN